MEVAQVSCISDLSNALMLIALNFSCACSEPMVSAGPASHGLGSMLMKGISKADSLRENLILLSDADFTSPLD